MEFRTYRASTVTAALAEVTRDLGRDAVILQTRPVRRAGLLGQWRRPVWEVVASPADSPERPDVSAPDSAPADRSVGPAADQEDRYLSDLSRQAGRMDQDMPKLRLAHLGKWVVYFDGEVLAEGPTAGEALDKLSSTHRGKAMVVRFVGAEDERDDMGGPKE